MTDSRPIRVLLSMLGLDQHEAGAFAVARLLRDAGMEVVYQGRFGVPEAIVEAAVQEGVDIIGLSCHSWEYLYYLDDMLQLMKDRGVTTPVVVGGSVLTQGDRDTLISKGVAATFGPGSESGEIIEQLREIAASNQAA